MNNLTVVLRTCDRESVHPERGARFIDVPKTELIKRCYISLLKTIVFVQNDIEIKLIILDDNSSLETIKFLKNQAKKYNVEYSLETCEQRGFNYSAFRQFELCKNKNSLVYCVEDDYLHYENAIDQMCKMYDKFSKITNSSIAIRPDDDPFTYSFNNSHSKKPSIVLLGDDRHWRTIYNTHNTIFTHSTVFEEYWELFASLSKFYKKIPINEDCSINLIWNNVPLFSPIPTLAIHISQNNKPHFIDFDSLWNNMSYEHD